MIYWRTKLPTRGGLYYFQNDELRTMHPDAVLVVQVSKFKNREGFYAECLVQPGAVGPIFNCDLDKAPAGNWAGPLPQPSYKR